MHLAVLVADYDDEARNTLGRFLGGMGIEVLSTGSGREALEMARGRELDLVLLGLRLSDMDGTAVCSTLRQWSKVPVIFISASDQVNDRRRALDAGGTDFLGKPLPLRELAARIRLHLSPSGPPSHLLAAVEIGSITIDRSSGVAHRADELIHLTPIERRLLCALLARAGDVVSYRELLDAVWDDRESDKRLVHVHISPLTKALGWDRPGCRHIRSVRGIGYCLEAGTAADSAPAAADPPPPRLG